MNVFSVKAPPRSLGPSRLALYAVGILSIGISIIYLSAILFTILILGGISSLGCVPVSVVLQIFELSLTVLSIAVAIIATYIDSDVQRRCTNYLETVYDDNPWLKDDDAVKCTMNRVESREKRSKIVKRLLLLVCLVHLGVSIYCEVAIGSTIFQILSVSIGFVSTLVSVILAFVSSLSCFAFGDDVQTILELVIGGLNTAFDELNSVRISASHSVSKQ